MKTRARHILFSKVPASVPCSIKTLISSSVTWDAGVNALPNSHTINQWKRLIDAQRGSSASNIRIGMATIKAIGSGSFNAASFGTNSPIISVRYMAIKTAS